MSDMLQKFKQRMILFGVLSVLFCGLFVYGLIANGNGAVERYNALIATDRAGGDVEGALRELRTYIYSHMNSEIGGPHGIYPPIQLSGTYDRLFMAEEARVEQVNSDLYPDAQAFCEANGNQSFSGGGRLDCINEYVDTNGAQPEMIDESLYKFDFVAPRWSPDLAGVSLLLFGVSTVFGVFFVLRFWHTKRLLKLSQE